MIKYKSVKIYQAEKVILNNVDFEASAGEFIYIIGKVGSGKRLAAAIVLSGNRYLSRRRRNRLKCWG